MAKRDINRAELARLIKEHESLKPINRTSAKTKENGKVERRVDGKFASPQKFTGARRSYESRIKKWEEKYDQLLKADQALYDQQNTTLTQKTESDKPRRRHTTAYKSKDLENVQAANRFLADSKPILATWHDEAAHCFVLAGAIEAEGDDFYQISIDFESIGKRIGDISDKITDSFKTLSSNPENIVAIRDAFFASMSKIDNLLKRKGLILIRYNKLVKKKADEKQAEADKEQKKRDAQAAKDQKKAEREQKKKDSEAKKLLANQAKFKKFKLKQSIKRLNQQVKANEKGEKEAERLKRQAEATRIANEKIESQRQYEELIANLEIKRFEIRQKLQEDKLRQRGYDVRSRPSLMGSRFSSSLAFAGINSDDERSILGPVASLFGKVGKNLGRGVKSLFSSKKEDPTEELRAVDAELFKARMMKRVSRFDSVRTPSNVTNDSSDNSTETTNNTNNSRGPSIIGDTIRSVKNLFSRSSTSNINDQDYNRTDDGEYLKEVKKTNEILTDILKFMKKTSKPTGSSGGNSGGLFNGLGGILGLLAGGASALLSSLVKPLTSLLGKVLLGGVGTIVKLAATVLPAVLSVPGIFTALVAGGFFALLKTQMSQLDAPNYTDPKTKDLMNLQGGMLPGVGRYKDYSNSSSDSSKVITSSTNMISSKGPNNIGGDSYKSQVDTASAINNVNNQKSTSTQTDSSKTAVQDTLMKAADFMTPTVIEDEEENSAQENLLELKKFLEGTFLDKLIEGLGEILKPKGGSGRSYMPRPRGL